MSAAVGAHDPMVFSSPAGLETWVECECGWISRGAYTAETALEMHARHTDTARAGRSLW